VSNGSARTRARIAIHLAVGLRPISMARPSGDYAHTPASLGGEEATSCFLCRFQSADISAMRVSSVISGGCLPSRVASVKLLFETSSSWTTPLQERTSRVPWPSPEDRFPWACLPGSMDLATSRSFFRVVFASPPYSAPESDRPEWDHEVLPRETGAPL